MEIRPGHAGLHCGVSCHLPSMDDAEQRRQERKARDQ